MISKQERGVSGRQADGPLTCPIKVIGMARVLAQTYKSPTAMSSEDGYAHSTELTIVEGIIGNRIKPKIAALAKSRG
jgi:hypothetical protein